MKLLFAIGAGSFIGGISRYLLALLIQGKFQTGFPLGTFSVNLLGCFLIGLVMGFTERSGLNENTRLFLVTGILGGFTTFSAFSYDAIHLLRENHYVSALLYIFGSVGSGLVATISGMALFRVF